MTDSSTRPTTMRALVQRSLGGPRALELCRDQLVPTPAAGELLLRVGAAGINFADVMRGYGTYGGGPAAPHVAGFEVAGEVVAHGAGVDPLSSPLGEHVVAAGAGAFAELVTVPATAALAVPDGWSDTQAIGLVLSWATALAAVRTLGEVQRDDVVVVHAAAGSVGQAVVRLAVHYGARVIAVASRGKHDAVRALGADAVVDSRQTDLTAAVLHATGGRPVDVVVDSVGRASLPTSLAVARPITGRVIVLGAASGETSVGTHDLVFAHPVQIKGLHIGTLLEQAGSTAEDLLDELYGLVEQGVYAPGTPHVHPLADGPSVLADLEAGRTVGKHALDPGLPDRRTPQG